MDTLNAKDLSIKQVKKLLGFQKVSDLGRYLDILSLEAPTEFEAQEVAQIAKDFERYLENDKVNEGLIKALTTFPLLRLTGFYSHPTELKLEENISPVVIEENDEVVKGRYDILAINHSVDEGQIPLWILIAEAKNSKIGHSAGLAQLLTYGHQSLPCQQSAWGLLTNGIFYQFVLMRQGTNPTYQLFMPLYLFAPEQANQLIQVLKALCKLRIATPLVPAGAG